MIFISFIIITGLFYRIERTHIAAELAADTQGAVYLYRIALVDYGRTSYLHAVPAHPAVVVYSLWTFIFHILQQCTRSLSYYHRWLICFCLFPEYLFKSLDVEW